MTAVRVRFIDREADVFTDGRTIDLESLVAALVAAGFPNSSQVQVAGTPERRAESGS